MTPSEAVVMDWLLERGYTREQAARALVALTLLEPKTVSLWSTTIETGHKSWAYNSLNYLAERRGYLPKP